MAVSKTKRTKSVKKIKNPRRAYKEKGALLRQAEKEMNAASQEAFKSFLAKHPELENERLFAKSGNRCFKRGEIPFSTIFPKVIHILIFRDGLNKTQKAVVAEVSNEISDEYPEAKINPNIWTKPLEGWALKKIQTQINGNLRPIVSIRGCKTLSDIRRILKANQHTGDVMFIYNGKITVTREAVLAGKARYPVIERNNESLYIQVTAASTQKRQWIRLDALVGFLENLDRKLK